ncbi:hypothetical protein BURKHO8Y_240236 [Burkholderia sp. 8Y]|nr:hypothetical protein BURKHO8Y_240236 [Burkholderia sp. 8Y]
MVSTIVHDRRVRINIRVHVGYVLASAGDQAAQVGKPAPVYHTYSDLSDVALMDSWNLVTKKGAMFWPTAR